MNRQSRILATALIATSLAAPLALADAKKGDRLDKKEEAFVAAQVSLTQAVATAEAEVNGKVMSAEFEREDGKWIYAIEILTSDHSEREVLVDARSGDIVGIEED